MTPTTAADKVKEIQLMVSKILVANQYKIKVDKNDLGVYAVDVPKASEAIADLILSRLVGELVEGWISVEDIIKVIILAREKDCSGNPLYKIDQIINSIKT